MSYVAPRETKRVLRRIVGRRSEKANCSGSHLLSGKTRRADRTVVTAKGRVRPDVSVASLSASYTTEWRAMKVAAETMYSVGLDAPSLPCQPWQASP